MLRVAGPRAWGVSSARDLSPEGVNLLATYSKVFAKVSCNWRACPRAFLFLRHSCSLSFFLSVSLSLCLSLSLFLSLFLCCSLIHSAALSFILSRSRVLYIFLSRFSPKQKTEEQTEWTFLFERKNRKLSRPSGTWHASPALSCSPGCPKATMYVNTFLLRPSELFNCSSRFFPQSPHLTVLFLSFSLLLSVSCTCSPFPCFCFCTFLPPRFFINAGCKQMDHGEPLLLFFFFRTLDRSPSSQWEIRAFDKALTNDARDKMHSTHRNFAHLSWFHLAEFRAWSARYQRYVNVSDNRLAAHGYMSHGSGAFDNTKSLRHDFLTMHTASCV